MDYEEQEAVLKRLRSDEKVFLILIFQAISSFVGAVSVFAFIADPLSQISGWFPNLLPWLKTISLNLQVPLFDKAYLTYIAHVRPFIKESLSWLTAYYPWNIPAGFYDYVLLNSILLSRPMSILFSELAIDFKLDNEIEQERKKSNGQTVGKLGIRYWLYRMASFAASIPPLYYLLSLGIFLVSLVLVLVFVYLITLLVSLLTFFLTSLGAGLIFPTLIAVFLAILVFFIFIDVLSRRSKLPAIIKLCSIAFLFCIVVLAFCFLVALSPYFAPIVAVFAVYAYDFLAIHSSHSSKKRIVTAPWIHFFFIVLGAFVFLFIFGIIEQ